MLIGLLGRGQQRPRDASTRHVVVAAERLQVGQTVVAAVVERVGGAAVGQLHGFAQGVVAHHHRLHQAVGGEFHRVQGRAVGRVGGGHIQLGAALLQRQHMVFLGEFLGNQFGGRLVEIQAGDVEGRQAELDREGAGHRIAAGQFFIDEVFLQGFLFFGRFIERGAGIGFAQGAILHQAPRDAGDSYQVGHVCVHRL